MRGANPGSPYFHAFNNLIPFLLQVSATRKSGYRFTISFFFTFSVVARAVCCLSQAFWAISLVTPSPQSPPGLRNLLGKHPLRNFLPILPYTAVMLLTTSGSRFPGISAQFAFVLVLIFFVTLIFQQRPTISGYLGHTTTIATALPTVVLSHDRPITFVVTENQKAHDEVVAPLIQSFSNVPGANFTAIFLSRMDRFGSFEMYRNLELPIAVPAPRDYMKEMVPFVLENPPDFIIATSCGYDTFDEYAPLLQNAKTHIFCTVHHSDNWKDWFFGLFEKKLGDWVKAGRVDFLTLSPHVAKTLPDSLLNWKEVKWLEHFPPIRTFPPVFTFNHPEPDPLQTDHIEFALQGNYQEDRRNFTRVFEELERAKQQLESAGTSTKVKLHLVGSGPTKPVVPGQVKEMVQFDENLNYTDFYTTLGGMTAILPAFADEGYFTHKASSSVPASLIAGSPLVATRKLLDAYSYLDESTVWLQKDDQSDFDVLWQVMRKPREERENKGHAVKAAAAALIEKNKAAVTHWVEVALAKRAQREQV